MPWREAVLAALHRTAESHGSRIVERQTLLDEELANIVEATHSHGLTPSQTLSRVLQDLRDEGIVQFCAPGTYLLLDEPVDVQQHGLPEEVLDEVIRRDKALFPEVEANEEEALTRRRRGQQRLRRLTLENYRNQCALCDVSADDLLIASHISRWADDPGARGKLTNMLCLCSFHDALFENGYIALTDEYRLLTREQSESSTVQAVLDSTGPFRAPASFPPAAEYLRKHRLRTGFGE